MRSISGAVITGIALENPLCYQSDRLQEEQESICAPRASCVVMPRNYNILVNGLYIKLALLVPARARERLIALTLYNEETLCKQNTARQAKKIVTYCSMKKRM